MTILPDHWALLTRLGFSGKPIARKAAQGFSKVLQLLGRKAPKVTRSSYYLTLKWIREWPQFWPNLAPGSREAGYVLCHFLLELFRLIFCGSSGYCVHVDWLVYIADVD